MRMSRKICRGFIRNKKNGEPISLFLFHYILFNILGRYNDLLVESRLTFGCRVSTEETSLWVRLEYEESGFVDDTFHEEK
jgi:hypothetical protein